jgi:hypothetical protein
MLPLALARDIVPSYVMLQSHSWLWHYLWLAPHVLQTVLAVFLCRRGLRKLFPVFFAYIIFKAIDEFTLYGMDILPSVSVRAWWLTFCGSVILEGGFVLGVIRELFCHLVRPRPVIVKASAHLFSYASATLVLLAIAAAAYAPMDHPQYVWTYRAHILLQSLYIIGGGLALFLFVFVAYHKLAWNSRDFGIALGFGVMFCEHVATYSVMATGALPYSYYYLFDFLNMATYHVSVLIWFYYLLAPHKSSIKSEVPLPENNLDSWNRELERLLQQ